MAEGKKYICQFLGTIVVKVGSALTDAQQTWWIKSVVAQLVQ
jgi:hypothetical protein